MSKRETIAKMEERLGYLLGHCDSDEETAVVEWVASHLAAEFGVERLAGVQAD